MSWSWTSAPPPGSAATHPWPLGRISGWMVKPSGGSWRLAFVIGLRSHQTQVVLAQEAADHKENEIKAALRVLQTLPLQDRVVTGDVMLAQCSLSQQVRAAGGDYFWVVKDNQPALKADIALLFAQSPFGEVFDQVEDRSRHGGRKEMRRLWAFAALTDYLQWPQAGQVCQLEQEVTCRGRPPKK
jgi:predicted transposase YbfD/YdcC